MKHIKVKDWVLEVDTDATREFYGAHYQITEGCDCIFCKNFVAAVTTLPTPVLDFFAGFGIDPTKEGEVSAYCENPDGTYLYGGFFHIVGRLISGPDCWTPSGNGEISHLTPELFEVNGFTFGFTYGLSLLPDDFPKPALQVEFQGNVSWVIDEKP